MQIRMRQGDEILDDDVGGRLEDSRKPGIVVMERGQSRMASAEVGSPLEDFG
jgi:hypothetical protein